MEFIHSLSQFPLIGEAASLLAALTWAFSMILYTGPASKLAPNGLNLYKNLIALGLLCLLVLVLSPPWPQDLGALGVLALSGLIGITLGDSAFFAALRHLGAQLTSVLQCLAPPLSALLAMAFYGETLSLTQTAGMLLTTAAVTGIILSRHRQSQQQIPRTSQSFFSGFSGLGKIPGLTWALVAALCQALGIVIARQALQTVDSTLGTLFRILPAVLGLAVYSIFREKGADIRPIFANPKLARRLALAALVGSFLGLILMSVGAKYAKTGISLALSSTYPLWVIPLARIYLKEPGDPKSYAWTVLAILGIVVMMV